MQDRKAVTSTRTAQWIAFLLLLTAAVGLASRSVLVRVSRMKAADTSVSAFIKMPPGTFTKVVVRVEKVAGGHLTCTLLQRETDAVYRLPAAASGAEVSAVLRPDTPIVMGKPADIVPGAIVQLAGVLDQTHTLRASEVVVLTGYVRVAENRPVSR